MTLAIDDDVIAREIIRQCHARGPAKSICPSEVARAFADEEARWRALMPDVRRVADVLRDEGRIAVMQRGQSISAVATKGPIRLSLTFDQGALRRAIRTMGPHPTSRARRR
jgi:hypothetical protein